ncbi:DUF3050 domain-containing protein [Chondromyces crocatus]|uniref:Heme oxygenase n=1 Tax=Chondromyces crocatus TaxID=52 RepID=A0A0K1EBJ4_CHOCO|nr:DUF3050 domain-containing protein [Chondromyces crocatus]AKT38052.1 uncharacterized protein CMC5_021930 [Chondromyces crocatus]
MMSTELMEPASSIGLLRDVEAQRVAALTAQVAKHPVFGRMASIADVRIFMEHHVWAVWDFMSLLKSVQEAIAPTRVPWIPAEDTEAARLVNEIVTGEECDEAPGGRLASHFEVYVAAMRRAGADVAPIERFVAALRRGVSWASSLAGAGAPAASRAFVETTMEVCAGPVHGRVAALTLGREDIIPAMFSRLVRGIVGDRTGELSDLVWYLDRHVEVDGSRHGPMTLRLFERICARDEATRRESLGVAERVLAQRLALWNAVESAVDARSAEGKRGRLEGGAREAPSRRL